MPLHVSRKRILISASFVTKRATESLDIMALYVTLSLGGVKTNRPTLAARLRGCLLCRHQCPSFSW